MAQRVLLVLISIKDVGTILKLSFVALEYYLCDISPGIQQRWFYELGSFLSSSFTRDKPCSWAPQTPPPLLFPTYRPCSLYLPLCYPLSRSDRHDMEVVNPTSVHWLVVGCAAEWLAHHSTSASGDRAIWIVFLSLQSATLDIIIKWAAVRIVWHTG